MPSCSMRFFADQTRNRSLLTVTLCLVIEALALNPARAAAPPKPVRALLVCGGCCHDYENQKTLIAEGLAERAAIEVTVVHQGGSTTNTKIPLYEKEDWADGYDVVIHDECFAGVNDRNWTRRILEPHRKGLPAVVVHCAMHCYRDGSDDWFQFCGVTSRRHGKAYPHEVMNRAPEHPVMKGFGAAWANPAGELYWIEKVWPTATPLASSKNRESGKEEVCVWANAYENTRVFGTTLGHHNETVSDPAYLDLLTRGTLWASGALDDAHLKPAKARQVPINVAIRQPATASSEETGKKNFAANAVDGNPMTRWCASGPQAGEWWSVDLGEPTPIDRAKLDWESPDGTYRYTVEGSIDKKTWTMLFDASKNAKKGAGVHAFPRAPYRYVRVTFLGSQGGWASLREVQLFGDRTMEVAPRTHRLDAEAEILGDVKVPEGYEKRLFAAPPAVNYPVFVAASPEGDVYVSVDKNGSVDRGPLRGAVVRLRDVDGDGRADESRYFVSDVDSPRGLVWDYDRLYLMHPPHLSVFIDHNRDGTADEEKVLVKNVAYTFKDRSADHTSNGVTLGVDGWLYLAIGDFGFLEAEGTDGRKLQLRGGGVVRVRPDGTGLELFARGTRNILEVGLDAKLNAFARDNTNDGGGWDIRLHHFSGLEEHGYPSLFKNFTAETVPPLAIYGGGSGCGALYMDEPGFPHGDGDALYTADWGREWIYRHKVSPNGATFAADQAEFIRTPRVTDLDVDAMSRLYVASWKGGVFTYAGEDVGYLVQVVPKGYQPEPLPPFDSLDAPALVALLESPSHRRRLEAQRTLIRRGVDDLTAASLQHLAANPKKPLVGRIAAIFALTQSRNSQSSAFLATLAADESIRQHALRALTDRKDERQPPPAQPILAALKDPNPGVRRQAVESLARLGDKKHGQAITARLDDEDPLVAHTAFKALVSLKAVEACFEVLDRAYFSDPARAGSLRALQSLHEPAVVDGLIERLDAETDPGRRLALFSALCRLDFREGPWKGNSWGTRPDTSGPNYQPEPWEQTRRIESALNSAMSKAGAADLAALLRELDRNKIRIGDGLSALVAKAEADPEFLPDAVAQLSRADRVPPAAVPLLVKIAETPEVPPEVSDPVRSQAIVALAKTDSEPSFRAIVVGLSRIEAGTSDLLQARDAFLTAAKLGNHRTTFEAIAQKHEGLASTWADAALLILSGDSGGSPETRVAATRALEAGWNDPARRIQILHAAGLAEYRPYAERIRAALTDPNRAVATAAAEAATRLNIDPKDDVPLPGPLVESMKADEAIAAALREKGDRARGDRLFTRVGCINCHTIKANEPPRGPFLGNIAKTYKRRELAEAILVPNKTIAQGFTTNVFGLADGRTLTGFVVQEAADKITLRNSEGREFRIPVADVEERAKSAVSVMPEGLLKGLSTRDFASLLDYLESLAR